MYFQLYSVIYLSLRKNKYQSNNLYVVSVSRSYLKFISSLNFITLLTALINTCKFFFFSLNCLVEVVYYLKQVFHLLYNKGVTSVENLSYISLIL